jgi:acetyl esterase/lipase
MVAAAGLVWLCSMLPACSADPPGVESTRDVAYGTGGGHPLYMNIAHPTVLPAAPMPAFVFIHGGGWRAGNKNAGTGFMNHFVQHGYFAASVEYRLSGEAIFPAQIEDCKCAIRFLRAKASEYHIDPDRIGVMGDSAGGHLVALLGTSCGVKELEGAGGWDKYSSCVNAVCDWYGPVDFLAMFGTGSDPGGGRQANNVITQLFGGSPQEKAELARSASPLTYIQKGAPPFLIMHGDKDPLVPLNQSQLLADALKKAGVEVTFRIVPNAGHGGKEFYSPDTLSVVQAFFDSHLGPK